LHHELVISSGGAAAVLGGTGCVTACELAGINHWDKIGGVSGGAIVASLTAAGLTARELLHLTQGTSFGDLLRPEHGMLGRLARLIPSRDKRAAETEHNRPDQHNWRTGGLYGSDCLGHFIEQRVEQGMASRPDLAFHVADSGAVWPVNFWTMATTKSGAQVAFDVNGAHHISVDGELSLLSSEPAFIGTAIRASCTIPGIMCALDYRGITLYDGALSRDGICPVGMTIRHFGSDPRSIIACRVGEDMHRPVSGRLHSLARRIWKVDPDFHWGPETEGVIECRPAIDHVHTLKFSLSEDEKWLAILVSFEATLSQLALHGILKGERLDKARSVLRCVGFWRDAIPAPIGSRQTFADRIRCCFTKHGLF